jgi:hypothetical protein
MRGVAMAARMRATGMIPRAVAEDASGGRLGGALAYARLRRAAAGRAGAACALRGRAFGRSRVGGFFPARRLGRARLAREACCSSVVRSMMSALRCAGFALFRFGDDFRSGRP